MKIRNFEYFASRVARKFDTVIQRSLYNYNGVWFANGMYMDFDGEFLYISESSNGAPTTVMACFVNCYNTQKDFFHDLDLLVSCNCIKKLTKTANTEEHEAEETSTTETTETKPEETATTETARSAKRKTDNQDIIENEDLDGIIENENLDETEETAPRNTIETLPPYIYNETDINPVCMKCQDENLLPYNCNKCDNKKVRKDSFYGMFGGFPSIPEMYNNKCFCCPADRQGNRCGGEQWCAETWKRYEAIIKPEWHHVSLSTIANLDFDMLDEKRQLYLKLHRELKELIQDLHKCKSGRAYERRLARMYIRNGELVDENKVSHDYINYFARKISMCNVECGLWTSKVEEATGLHESRRYSRPTLKY